MTRLESLLSTFPELTDAAGILARITAKTRRVVVYAGLQTVAAFTKAYGYEETAALLLTIKTAIATLSASEDVQTRALGAFVETYSTKFINAGLDFSDPDMEATIGLLIPLIGEDFVAKLNALGVRYISECDTAGIDAPTLDDVNAAIAVVLEGRA